MRTIAFISQKGGCGKTTSCVNIAVALAEMERRVLIVDLDSNACASRTFNVIVKLEDSIGAALLDRRSLGGIIRATPIDKIWLAPGSTDLTIIEQMHKGAGASRANGPERLSEAALANQLGQLRGACQFDYVFLDCPGGYPFMQRMALLACDEVIIPSGLSVYDLYAATPTLQLILAARRARRQDQPLLLGFLPNGAGKAGVPKKIQTVLDTYSAPRFSPIRHSALLKSVAGAPKVEQRAILLARPDHVVSASYRQVAQEIEFGLEAARKRPATQSRGDDSGSSHVVVEPIAQAE